MGIHNVSEVTNYIKRMFQREPVLGCIQVRGELSNFRCYASGHCYFTLKDAASAIKCVMFRSRAQGLRFRPENGMQVVVSGSISVYERDGVYQLYADHMMPEGAGDLALAFEQLKARLASVQLVLRPVLVQGEEAAAQIAAAVAFFNEKYPVDVLIVGRGGGSMEDLWAFNEEPVVRAIYASKIPVISAVGHETDFTLADFASDQRAATPSQAAELAVPDRAELLRYTESLMARLSQQERRQLQEKRLRLAACLRSAALQNPQLLLAGRAQRLDRAIAALESQMKGQMKEKRHALEIVLQQLDYLNPVHILRQGYGIVEKEGAPLTSVRAVKAGDLLTITLKDGRIPARAVKVQGEDNQEQ